MSLRLLALAIAAVALAACSDGDSSPGGHGGSSGGGGLGGAGGATTEMTVTPAMFVSENQPLAVVLEGAPIALSFPLQGGHVLFVGAVVTNLRSTTVNIRGRLRDPISNQVVGEEARTVVMQPVPGAPLSWQSDVRTNSQVSNIPVCPNYTTRNIAGEAYVLEVSVTELYVDVPRTVTGSRNVVPTCSVGQADSALCACECASNYALGKCPASK